MDKCCEVIVLLLLQAIDIYITDNLFILFNKFTSSVMPHLNMQCYSSCCHVYYDSYMISGHVVSQDNSIRRVRLCILIETLRRREFSLTARRSPGARTRNRTTCLCGKHGVKIFHYTIMCLFETWAAPYFKVLHLKLHYHRKQTTKEETKNGA